MQVKDLNDEQRALLEAMLERSMISAAAQALMSDGFRDDMSAYVSTNPGCSAADAIKAALGDAVKNEILYAPSDINNFLESLED